MYRSAHCSDSLVYPYCLIARLLIISLLHTEHTYYAILNSTHKCYDISKINGVVKDLCVLQYHQ